MVSPLKKHIEESPKLRELKRRRHARRMRFFALFGFLFLVLIALFIFAANHPRFQLTSVVVSGNEVVDADDVIAHADAFLAGKYLYSIPHRNAFFYPKKKILADLVESYPRFKEVAVYRRDLNTLLINVVELRGQALWCASETDSPEDARCYFTDDTGKIIDTAPYYSGNVYARFLGGGIAPEDSNPLGKNFITSAQFTALLSFASRITAMGFPVKSIHVGSADEEDSLSIDLGGGHTAKFRFLPSDDYGTIADNLALALSKQELGSAVKNDRANLEYFDLRFTNKVYYKFSDQTQ